MPVLIHAGCIQFKSILVLKNMFRRVMVEFRAARNRINVSSRSHRGFEKYLTSSLNVHCAVLLTNLEIIFILTIKSSFYYSKWSRGIFFFFWLNEYSWSTIVRRYV